MKKFLSLALALVMVLAITPVMIPTAKAAWIGKVNYATSAPAVDGARDALYGEVESMAETRPAAFNGTTMKYWVAYDAVNVYMFIEVHCPNGYTYMDKPNGNFITPRLDWDDNNSVWQDCDAMANIGLNSNGTLWTSGNLPGNKGKMAGSISEDGKTVYFEISAPRSALHTTSNKQLTAGDSFMAGAHFNGINASGNLQNMGATFDNSWATTQAKPEGASNLSASYVVTSGTPVIDGKVKVDEWGELADLAINEKTANGGRLHYLNGVTGGSKAMPETQYFWSHDADYLYLAVVIGTGTPHTLNSITIPDSIFTPGKHGKPTTLTVSMGNATFNIQHTSNTSFTVNGAPAGTQVKTSYENKIATYEIAIPIASVTAGSDFTGYVRFNSVPADGFSNFGADLYSSAMSANPSASNPIIRDNFTLSDTSRDTATRPTSAIKLDGMLSVTEWGEAVGANTTAKADVEYFIRQDDKGMYIAARANSTLAQSGYQSGLVLRSATAGYLGCTVIRGAAHAQPGSVANNFTGAIVRSGNIITVEIFLTWAQLKVTDGSKTFNGRIEWHDYTNANTDTMDALGGAGNHVYGDGNTGTTVSSITVVKNPDKTTYAKNESFNPYGMVLLVNYTDGTTGTIVDGFTVLNGDRLVAGQSSVTISYRGYTFDLEIFVEGMDETAWAPSASGAPGAAPAPDAAPVETPAAGKPHGFGSFGPAGQPIPAPCDTAIRGPKAKF